MNEGDAFNAAKVNAEVDALVTKVNALTLEANVRPRALGRKHLVGLLSNDAGTDKNKGDGMNVGTAYTDWSSRAAGGAFEAYSNELPPAGGWPKVIQPTGAPPLGPGSGASWRRVARGGVAGNECKVTWPSGTTFNDYAGYLVSASICVGDCAAGSEASFENSGFALGIAIVDNAGNYYVVPRSVRLFNPFTVEGERVSLTTLLKQTDVAAASVATGGPANVVAATLVFGRFLADKTPSITLNGNGDVELGPYNITQVPIHYGALS